MDFIRAQDPSVVFIAKTWLDKARLEFIKMRIKYGGMLEVSRVTRGGALAIFWTHDIDLSIETYSPKHIDTIINQGKEDEWRVGDEKSSCVVDCFETVELKIFNAIGLCRGFQ